LVYVLSLQKNKYTGLLKKISKNVSMTSKKQQCLLF